MKIFHVLNHFLPDHQAGTEIYTWALSKQLQSNNVEVTVIIPHYHKTEPSEYFYDDIRVFEYAEPSIVDRDLIMGFRSPDGLRFFQEKLEIEKPDVVHFHEFTEGNGITLQHVVVAKKAGAKVIMTFHLAHYTCKTGNLVYLNKNLCDGVIDIQKCSRCYLLNDITNPFYSILPHVSSLLYSVNFDTNGWKNKFGTALGAGFRIKKLKDNLDILAQNCDKLVVLTEWYKQILLLNNIPEEKITFIPQGLPVSYQPSEYQLKKYKISLPIQLIFLGRVSPKKGLHLLLQALSHLPEDKVELDIYGQSLNDDYEKECRKLTDKMKNIRWKGNLKQHEVTPTIQKYDALCLCSTFSEMSPLVIQEAFAAGVPVIASNVLGNAEQITHRKNGLLFNFKDSNSLREQLQFCINDPALLFNLKQNIIKPLNFNSIGDKYFILYNQLLEKSDNTIHPSPLLTD